MQDFINDTNFDGTNVIKIRISVWELIVTQGMMIMFLWRITFNNIWNADEFLTKITFRQLIASIMINNFSFVSLSI